VATVEALGEGKFRSDFACSTFYMGNTILGKLLIFTPFLAFEQLHLPCINMGADVFKW